MDNSIYQKLREAGLLDTEMIIEIVAYQHGLAYKETQLGYSEHRRRCNSADILELTKKEIADGTYQRKLRNLSDPQKSVEDKPFTKVKRGRYNINFTFIEKDIQQRSRGLLVLREHGIFGTADNYVKKFSSTEVCITEPSIKVGPGDAVANVDHVNKEK